MRNDTIATVAADPQPCSGSSLADLPGAPPMTGGPARPAGAPAIMHPPADLRGTPAMAGASAGAPSGAPGAGRQALSCPSARPDSEGAVIFGVAGGTVEQPRVGYLERAVKPTSELLALTAPADPAAVFRFGGRCVGSGCSHFAAEHCTLGDRLVQLLPVVTERLPPCVLRPTCRWWREQGAAACRRCPQVVTQSDAPSAELALAATPPNLPSQE